MASTAITKAIRTLESRQKRDFRQKVKKVANDGQLIANGSALFGGGLAAFLDAKRAEPGEVAEFGKSGIPVNVVVGPALAIGALFLPDSMSMIKNAAGGLGVGMGVAGIYRQVYDRMEAAEDEAE